MALYYKALDYDDNYDLTPDNIQVHKYENISPCLPGNSKFDFSKHVLIELLDNTTPESQIWRELGLLCNKRCDVLHKRLMLDSHRVNCRRAIVVCTTTNAAKKLVERVTQTKIANRSVCAVLVQELLSDVRLFENRIADYGDSSSQQQLVFVTDLSRSRTPAKLVSFLKSLFSPFGTIHSILISEDEDGLAFPEGVIRFDRLSEAFAAELAYDQKVVDMERLSVTTHHNILLSQCDLRARLREAHSLQVSMNSAELPRNESTEDVDVESTSSIVSARITITPSQSATITNEQTPMDYEDQHSDQSDVNSIIATTEPIYQPHLSPISQAASQQENAKLSTPVLADVPMDDRTSQVVNWIKGLPESTADSRVLSPVMESVSAERAAVEETFVLEQNQSTTVFIPCQDLNASTMSSGTLVNDPMISRKYPENEACLAENDSMLTENDFSRSMNVSGYSGNEAQHSENVPVFPGNEAIGSVTVPVFSGSEAVGSINIPVFSGNEAIGSENVIVFSGNEAIDSVNIPVFSGNEATDSVNVPVFSENVSRHSENVAMSSKNESRHSATVPIFSEDESRLSANVPVFTGSFHSVNDPMSSAEEQIQPINKSLLSVNNQTSNNRNRNSSSVSSLDSSIAPTLTPVKRTNTRLISSLNSSNSAVKKIDTSSVSSFNSSNFAVKKVDTSSVSSLNSSNSSVKRKNNLSQKLSLKNRKLEPTGFCDENDDPSGCFDNATTLCLTRRCSVVLNRLTLGMNDITLEQNITHKPSKVKASRSSKLRSPSLASNKTSRSSKSPSLASEKSVMSRRSSRLASRGNGKKDNTKESPLRVWLKQELSLSINNRISSCQESHKSIVCATVNKDVLISVGCSHMTCEFCYPDSMNLLLGFH